MTSAAQRWFVSDKEYYNRVRSFDYAVAWRNSADTTPTLKQVDILPHPEHEHFGDLFDDVVIGDHLWFTYPGAMIYADVEGTEDHKAAMQDRHFCEGLQTGEEDNAEIEKARKRVFDLYRAALPEAEYNEADEKDRGRFMRRYADKNRVQSFMIDHIVGMKSKGEKQEALAILSGEIMWKAPRPVMVMINLYDDCQSTSRGTGSGYIIAYDMVEDLILEKAYTSSPDHHPLGDPWDCASTTLKCSPGDLARRIADRTGLDEASSSYGFDLVNRIIAGCWIMRHADALQKVEEPGHGELLDEETLSKMEDVISAHETDLEKIPFPKKTRGGQGDDVDGHGVDYPYGPVLDILERFDELFRDQALHWKETGNEQAVTNVVKFYDGVTKAAEALQKDPKEKLELWQS
ncbi:MAG: hypothetical protein M1812_001679 [Candelaria pacifica]|nr:MAG: hypothetical protein M1812_001679 [Candelaria pacifica]